MAYVEGSHHVTLSVGYAQDDVDFHVKILGLRLIKRTVLFDGSVPIYHLYYTNARGDPSSVLTTFPWAKAGVTGQRGTNQAREVLLSIPHASMDYWQRRLREHDVEVADVQRFEQRRLAFRHPSGIEYVFVGNNGDERIGHTGYGVPQEHAIHGLHGVGVHVASPDRMVEFADESFHAHGRLTEEGDVAALQVGTAAHGNHLEITANRTDDQGTWRFGAGTCHHFAWNVDTAANQNDVKFELEGQGYTDISEIKDRKYFKSTYIRTPGGALFELAITHEDGGWTCDESPQELGTRFQLPEHFEHRRREILDRLEPITP
ncbi:VOC family protein [Saccharopolyspora sp. HNM0983]|uniref:VOC family protein n=1 Tax=Saccharopolyspora montiporae TaxID=2781240 RepID=A0A929FYW3_9PSEU|nr:VOC family protein [Saccharopolyspora sp. HNM0983]MBE9373764.1 VOC family protein [Saccharopolyspora sp. HNM0983]